MSIFKKGTIKPVVQIERPEYRFAIIVGHESSAQGATGAEPMKMSEYKFHTKFIAPQMERMAMAAGLVPKIFLRDGLGIGGVGKAVSEWAKGYKACAIELHFNWAPGAEGSETLFDSYPLENETFALLVQKKMCAALGRSGMSRGLKPRDSGRGSHNLTSVTCVGCLVEPAFANNTSEATLLWTRQKEYAEALVSAAVEFLQKS